MKEKQNWRWRQKHVDHTLMSLCNYLTHSLTFLLLTYWFFFATSPFAIISNLNLINLTHLIQLTKPYIHFHLLFAPKSRWPSFELSPFVHKMATYLFSFCFKKLSLSCHFQRFSNLRLGNFVAWLLGTLISASVHYSSIKLDLWVI